LSAGIGFSLTNVITRKSSHLTIKAKSFAVWIGVVLASLLFIIVTGDTLHSASLLTWNNWLILTVIALLLIAATGLVQFGVTKITATRASVLFLFELVVAAVASYYLAHEVMAWNEWLGGLLIISAAVFAAFNHQGE
jgi:drug/metabolite transporter (DMT)-like permease